MPAASPSRRVWIADDSPLEAAIVREALASRFAVEVFNDGASLIERASVSPPAVMILDWHMPGMTGLEVCRFLRSQPETMQVGVLILTGANPRTSDVVEALGAGANDYLVKPFEATELVARVEALFRTRDAHVRAAEESTLLSVLLDQLPDAVLAFDARGRLTFGNSEARRVFAWPGEPPVGKPLEELVPSLAQSELSQDRSRAVPVAIADRFFMPAVRQIALGGSAPLVTVSLRDVTERYRAEERRVELETRSRERLANILMQAPTAIMVLRGPDYVIELANEQCLRLLDRGAGVIGQRARELFAELRHQPVWDVLDETYRTGNTYLAQEFGVRVDERGEERFFNWTCQSNRGHDDALYGLIIFAVEVTEQVRSRRRIEQLAVEQRAVLGRIQESVIFADSTGRIAFLNDAASALLGPVPVGGISVQSFAEKFSLFSMEGHPLEASALPLTRAMRGETVTDMEWMFRRPDGTFRIVQGSASPVFDDKGTRIGVVMSMGDVTERRTLERTVRASEQRYRSLIEASSQIVWTTSADGKMVGPQSGWTAFTGQRHDEYRGYGWTDAVHPDDRALTMALWRQAIDSSTAFFCDHRVRRHDGVYRDFTVRAVPVTEADGSVREWVGVHSDISDAKRLEDERIELFERERQARSDAEAANRTKDEFLAMLGHELRNPLSPILTAVQLMKARGITGYEREYDIIERQLHHMVSLVDDLLDVSRVTQGKITLKKRLVEISHVLTRAVEIASPLLEERSHELTISVPPVGLVVDADPVRLAQVVANLLTNAAKFTEVGGKIEVLATKEGPEIVVRVRDSGVGIATDMLGHVFDMFVQNEPTIERSHGGLGLGLAIVRSLVELHAGRVSVHSDGLGRGSEFVVRLPAVEGVSVAVRKPVATDTSPIVLPRPTGRILVVDDNVDAADLLSMALTAAGYTTEVAHDAPSALKTARAFSPDLALLDIGLPVMDGYELAAQIRMDSTLSKMKLVALTGYGQENDKVRARAAGFHDHLVKPVDLGNLRTVLQELLAEPAS